MSSHLTDRDLLGIVSGFSLFFSNLSRQLKTACRALFSGNDKKIRAECQHDMRLSI